jgi:hypothetical protein
MAIVATGKIRPIATVKLDYMATVPDRSSVSSEQSRYNISMLSVRAK